MKPPRQIIPIACIVASFIAIADEKPSAEASGPTNRPIAAELQSLQGTWEGSSVGDGAPERVTVRINGSSLHFHRDTNFWFETSIALPAGTDPKQLHATIKGCPPSQAESIGKVVGAIFKIEDGALTLLSYDMSAAPPKNFDSAVSRYVLKKVQPREKRAEPPQSK